MFKLKSCLLIHTLDSLFRRTLDVINMVFSMENIKETLMFLIRLTISLDSPDLKSF